MLNKIKEFFFGKPAAVEAKPEAPYKVETPTLTVVEAAPTAKAPAKKAKAPAKPKAEKTSTPKARKPRAPKAK